MAHREKLSWVKGDGPDRRELVTFADLGAVDDSIVQRLNNIATQRQGNDLDGDNYSISQHQSLKDKLPEAYTSADKYRQILLQESNKKDTDRNEYAYTHWNTDPVELSMFDKIYRCRISEMGPGHGIDWHIDQNSSVVCRAQICLNDNTSIMQFNRRGEVSTLEMKKGHVYFLNTGWNHRVVNGDSIRRVAIFAFDYNDYVGDVELKCQ